MRSYAITCEFCNPKKSGALLSEQVRRLSREWSHPHASMWLVKTELSAAEIRTALLPHLHFNDRLFILEAGEDHSEFNSRSAAGGNVVCIDAARKRSHLLARIFSRDGTCSRHLKAATSKSLQSA
jgi:hypothetical protein